MKLNEFFICVFLHIIVASITTQFFMQEGLAFAIVAACVADLISTVLLVLAIPFIDEALDFFINDRQKGAHIFNRLHLPTKFLHFLNIYSLNLLESWVEYTE